MVSILIVLLYVYTKRFVLAGYSAWPNRDFTLIFGLSMLSIILYSDPNSQNFVKTVDRYINSTVIHIMVIRVMFPH